jgi:hypothetical protein
MTQRHTTEPKRFKIRYIVYGLLLVLLGWFAFFRISVKSDLARRLRELSEAGYALSLTELDERYVLPDEADNAADYYLTAFSEYGEPNDEAKELLPWVGKAEKPPRTEPVDETMQQAIAAFLSDNEKALTLLHEALALEHSQYPMDFSRGPDMSMPWLKDVRRSAFLLSLEGLAACAQDDPNRALESVHATLALAQSLDCPLLINRLVQIAIRALACRNIEQILNRVTLTDEQLQTLERLLEIYTDEEGYRQALIGERCFGLYSFRTPGGISSDMGGGKVLSLILVPMKIFGLHDRDMLSYVNLMQDYIDALDLPLGERLAAYEAVAEDFSSGKRGGLLTRILMPALLRTYQLEMRHVADRRVARTSLAVERYRLAQGKPPQGLDELIPTYLDAVPTDPFDGQALRYSVLAKGYVVYSIGEDGNDDGGAERKRENRRSDGTPIWDVTFFVER